MKLFKALFSLFARINDIYVSKIKRLYYTTRLGYCGKNVYIKNPICGKMGNIYMYDDTNIYHGLKFISDTGRLIMKRGAGSAQGLTIITGNHGRKVGQWFKDSMRSREEDVELDVIIEEDVWIGADVIICAGVTIGRGANIGAGSVVRSSIPPYAVVIGNPAKIVGFSFSPEEALAHESLLYQEAERTPLELLEKNYKKYFLDRISEIKSFTKI